MKDRKEDGTEVLIFERNIWTGKDNEKKFIRGTIVGCELSHDLSQHGSPWYENIYTILGEDKHIYKGTYGSKFLGECFIRTPEDHIAYLKRQISLNNDKIDILNKENNEYSEMINDVEKVKEQIELEESIKLEPLKTNSYAHGSDLQKKREQIKENLEEARKEIEELNFRYDGHQKTKRFNKKRQ